MLDLSRIVQGSGEQFFGDIRLQVAEHEDIGVFRSAGPLKRRPDVGSLLAAQLLQGIAWLVGLTQQLRCRSESGLGLAQKDDAASWLDHSAGAGQRSRQFRKAVANGVATYARHHDICRSVHAYSPASVQ